MPLYDYKCDQCETVFEVERRMSDTSRKKCPACRSKKTAKVFNAAGIVFKGSGFYVTDSKNGSSASTPPASPVSTVEKDVKADKPSDAAEPAAKPKPKGKTD